VQIDFYTDPLCCWSYAFEKHWERFITEHADKISYRYVLCGMIRDWRSYSDPVNAVSRPLQMGPVWMHASHVTHVAMESGVWFNDPPASSYPACLAVKTAAIQSQKAEEAYLRQVRRALFHGGRNIAKADVLHEVARETAEACPELFDADQFKVDFATERSKALFRNDLKQARFHTIGRFPTLTVTNEAGKGLIMVGYRPYEALTSALDFLKKF
jgi:predicted DsbA family dithiol-disulfide isomerase